MITHSEITGPWIPEEVVRGIFEEVKIGCSTSEFTPADERWMNSVVRDKLVGIVPHG